MRLLIELTRWVLTLACIGLGGFIVLLAAERAEKNAPRIVSSEVVEPSERELAAAHRRHGINYSWEDNRGEWWFTNERGEKCKLFADRLRP